MSCESNEHSYEQWTLIYLNTAKVSGFLGHTGHIGQLGLIRAPYMTKKVREKSWECHNHIPQPLPDTRRKRKQTKPNKLKSNKRTKSTKISSLLRKRGDRNATKAENTQEQNNTKKDVKQIARQGLK